MKMWQYVLTASVALAITILVVSFFPDLKFLDWIWWLLAGILAGLVIFLFAPLVGFLIRLGFGWLDDHVDDGSEISSAFYLLVGLIFAVAIGAVQIELMRPALTWNTWVREVAMHGGWPGAYETPPYWWAAYGIPMFLVGYYAKSIKENFFF
jgi:hypothetical protein